MKSNSEIYAERDGLKVEIGTKYGRRQIKIHVPCAKCGADTIRGRYDPEKVYLCDLCQKSVEAKKKAVYNELYSQVRTPKEKQFDKAVERLTSISKTDYSHAIDLAMRRAEQYGSVPEVMTAIVLVHHGFKVIPQQKVGRYKVDFCLPDLKVALEVDGSIYHSNKSAQNERDISIQYALGFDWDIIHIPAELIYDKPWKVPTAIYTMLRHREK